MARKRERRPSRSGGWIVFFVIFVILAFTAKAVLAKKYPAGKAARPPAVEAATPAKPVVAVVPAPRAKPVEPKALVSADVGASEDEDAAARSRAAARLKARLAERSANPPPAIESVGVAPPPSKPAKPAVPAPTVPAVGVPDDGVGKLPVGDRAARQFMPSRVVVGKDGCWVDVTAPVLTDSHVDARYGWKSAVMKRHPTAKGGTALALSGVEGFRFAREPEWRGKFHFWSDDVPKSDQRGEVSLTREPSRTYERVWFEVRSADGSRTFEKFPKEIWGRLYEAAYQSQTAWVEERHLHRADTAIWDGLSFFVDTWAPCQIVAGNEKPATGRFVAVQFTGPISGLDPNHDSGHASVIPGRATVFGASAEAKNQNRIQVATTATWNSYVFLDDRGMGRPCASFVLVSCWRAESELSSAPAVAPVPGKR